jgi:ABC-2 type transport system ATP-binding protein
VPATPANAVEFHNVRKVFRRGLWPRARAIQALRGASFTVPAGSLFGLLGPNRAGKTTLVKILLTISRPTSGTIQRLDRPWADRRTLARVGFVHEHQSFAAYLTARGLLDYYGALSRVAKSDLRQRIPALLDEVGLADRAGDPIATFSKGMLQRLALAQALVANPELLVLDEPAEGMDLLARQMLHGVLRKRQRLGHTALLVSHSLADVESLCDRVAVMRAGEVAFTGPLDELVGDTDQNEPRDLEDALEPLYAGAAP